MEQAENNRKKDSDFGMIKRMLNSMPMTKPFGAVVTFFESCGISLTQIKKMAGGQASSQELDQTITPIVYKTQPAMKNALSYLEEEYADGKTGGAYFLIKNVKTSSGEVEPYIFLCTSNVQKQNVAFDHFQYFRAASYILKTIDDHKKRIVSQSLTPSPNDDVADDVQSYGEQPFSSQ